MDLDIIFLTKKSSKIFWSRIVLESYQSSLEQQDKEFNAPTDHMKSESNQVEERIKLKEIWTDRHTECFSS